MSGLPSYPYCFPPVCFLKLDHLVSASRVCAAEKWPKLSAVGHIFKNFGLVCDLLGIVPRLQNLV